MENESKASFCGVDWEETASRVFNFAEFVCSSPEKSPPVKAYEHDSEHKPETESPNVLDARMLMLKLNRANDEDYHIHTHNGRFYDLSIDNLELTKVNTYFLFTVCIVN